MSCDFAVFAADIASDRASALAFYQAMCAENVGEPSPAVREVVTVLNRDYGVDRDDGFLSIDAVGDARGAVVCTRWPTAAANLRTLLELTKDRDLALFDPQSGRLYNPRGKVDVNVTVGDGTTSPYLTEALLTDLLERPDPTNPYLIVERAENVYIQTYMQDGAYDLEHRAGGPDRHFHVRTADRNLVHYIIGAWTTGDSRWETAAPWSRLAM